MDPNALKEAGNDAVRAQDYAKAEELYTQAISNAADHGAELRAVLLYNRCVARLRRKNFDGALADADAALALKRDYAKALSAKGAAQMNLGRLEEAVETFKAG